MAQNEKIQVSVRVKPSEEETWKTTDKEIYFDLKYA